METYSFLRELADSWVLLAMCIFYVGAILWAFRPGSRALHADIADIPFRNEQITNDRAGLETAPAHPSAQIKPEAH